MRLFMLLPLGAAAMLCAVPTAKAGVVILDGTRSVSVFPESSSAPDVTPSQGPKVEQNGAGVFGEEIVEQAFAGPGQNSAFGRASQVSIIDETGFDFHGQVSANTTSAFILARSFLSFTFDVDTPTNYEFRFDYGAVPDVGSQNPDSTLDVLELSLFKQENGGGQSLVYVQDKTFAELFADDIPNALGTLAPGRYVATALFDAPVRGEENVDLTYDIGLTLGGNMPPPPPTGIPLPPAAWAGLVTMAIAGVGPLVRRLRN